MKKLMIPLLLLICTPMFAQQDQLTQSFENYAELLKSSMESQDKALLANLVSDSVTWTSANGESVLLSNTSFVNEILSNETHHEILSGALNGFRFVKDEPQPTFLNASHRSTGGVGWVVVKTQGLRLRKLPSSNGTVVALLDEDIYSGGMLASKPSVSDFKSGFQWIPVKIFKNGKAYSGYVSEDYVDILPSELPTFLKVSLEEDGWKISGLYFENPMSSCEPSASL